FSLESRHPLFLGHPSNLLQAVRFHFDRTCCMAAHILSISKDRALLATRHMLLERVGYSIVSVEGFKAAVEQCEAVGDKFDLVILGHSFPHKDKQAFTWKISKSYRI